MTNCVANIFNLDAHAAIERLNELYRGDCNGETLFETQILAAHLNNLWPEELQAALPLWISTPEPPDDDGKWRQLNAFWTSLYKKKAEVQHRHEELSRFCALVSEFAGADQKSVGGQFLKDLYVEAYSARNAKNADFHFLRISAFYYRAKAEDVSMRYEDYMQGLLRWFFYNQDIAVDPAVVAIYVVHTEGLDRLDFDAAKCLIESQQLGWISWWHLPQLNDRVLDKLSRDAETLKCTDDAREVLTAVARHRFG